MQKRLSLFGPADSSLHYLWASESQTTLGGPSNRCDRYPCIKRRAIDLCNRSAYRPPLLLQARNNARRTLWDFLFQHFLGSFEIVFTTWDDHPILDIDPRQLLLRFWATIKQRTQTFSMRPQWVIGFLIHTQCLILIVDFPFRREYHIVVLGAGRSRPLILRCLHRA